MADMNEIQRALDYVEPKDRETWLKMGAAIKDELGEDGFNTWDAWSAKDDTYKAKDATSVWKSLRAGHIKINTLFYTAKQNGYTPDKTYTPPSAAELARQHAQSLQQRQTEQQQKAELQAKAKQTANWIWEKSQPAQASHPYLQAKGITDPQIISQLRQSEYKGKQNLIIPVKQNKELVSLQFIDQNGEKSFLANGQIKGSHCLIGDSKKLNEAMVIAEGFATAASINEATGTPVLVAFNAGNILEVAKKAGDNLPKAQVIIAADNDASKTGLSKAKQAAEYLGDRAKIVMPLFTNEQIQSYQNRHGALNSAGKSNFPTDFNDLRQLSSKDEVYRAMQTNTQEQTTETKKASTKRPTKTATKTPSPKAKTERQANGIEFDSERSQLLNQEEQVAANQAKKPATAKQESQAVKHQATEQNPANPTTQIDLNKAAITHLDYLPPEHLTGRYVYAKGQYVSAENGKTVLFTDKGTKLSTAKTDSQTVKDMLDVAKHKNWDSIKLSGSKDFKQMAYVMAESQGISTRGYSPTEADLAMVQKLRDEYALNKIEPQNSQKQQPTKGDDQLVSTQVDTNALAEVDRLRSMSEMPTSAQVISSEEANPNATTQDFSSGSIPAEVSVSTANLESAALDTKLVSAKNIYDTQAQSLDSDSHARLQFYERMTINITKDLKDDDRKLAMSNYYTSITEHMNEKTFDMPIPMQVQEQEMELSKQEATPELER